MTKKQCMQKVRELAQTMRQDLIEEAERLFDSGAIEKKEYDDDYRLPKILITAAIKRRGDGFSPLADEGKAELKNLLQW